MRSHDRVQVSSPTFDARRGSSRLNPFRDHTRRGNDPRTAPSNAKSNAKAFDSAEFDPEAREDRNLKLDWLGEGGPQADVIVRVEPGDLSSVLLG